MSDRAPASGRNQVVPALLAARIRAALRRAAAAMVEPNAEVPGGAN
nr:hypothetical protein [Nitrosomonas nitrosa]